MKRILLLSILSTIICIFGCIKAPVKTTSPTKTSCQALDTFPITDTTGYKDDYTLKGDTVTGDDLHLTVTYGGGCKTHKFKLIYNQLATPPFPVVNLSHEANNDNCKSLITDNICFDISYFKKTLGTTHGTVQFPLHDNHGNSFNVKYTY